MTGSEYSRQYVYVRSRQLEGTFPGDPATGTWLITSARVACGWGQPPETAWPYNSNAAAWPPEEPAGIDLLAKQHRLPAYQRVRELDECKPLLAAGFVFSASFTVVIEQWRNAPGGTVELPDTEADATGSHTVTVVGYDDATCRLKFMNSWGTRWGDNGYGTLPYDLFDRFLLEAWTLGLGKDHRPQPTAGVVEREWGEADLLGDILHGVEYCDAGTDEKLGWAFAVVREGHLDVEELFVRPGARRRGLGGGLAKLLVARAERLGLPLRMWVSHADTADANLSAIARTTRPFGLRFEDSPVRWASYLLTI